MEKINVDHEVKFLLELYGEITIKHHLPLTEDCHIVSHAVLFNYLCFYNNRSPELIEKRVNQLDKLAEERELNYKEYLEFLAVFYIFHRKLLQNKKILMKNLKKS